MPGRSSTLPGIPSPSLSQCSGRSSPGSLETGGGESTPCTRTESRFRFERQDYFRADWWAFPRERVVFDRPVKLRDPGARIKESGS